MARLMRIPQPKWCGMKLGGGRRPFGKESGLSSLALAWEAWLSLPWCLPCRAPFLSFLPFRSFLPRLTISFLLLSLESSLRCHSFLVESKLTISFLRLVPRLTISFLFVVPPSSRALPHGGRRSIAVMRILQVAIHHQS